MSPASVSFLVCLAIVILAIFLISVWASLTQREQKTKHKWAILEDRGLPPAKDPPPTPKHKKYRGSGLQVITESGEFAYDLFTVAFPPSPPSRNKSPAYLGLYSYEPKRSWHHIDITPRYLGAP